MLLELKQLVIIQGEGKLTIEYFLEPLVLKIGNEYNLNNVKEISITEDFLTLDKTIIKCQNEESLQDCKTRKYIDTMVEQCNCLPFGIRNNIEVLSTPL